MQVLFFLFVLGLLFFTGCKTSENAFQYTLTVTVGEGINGAPATGSFSHADGDVVTYNYSLQAGYENLEVKVDGVTVANFGVITMNINHTLTVTADEQFNPTGDWEGLIWETGSDYFFSVTFSGDFASGTASAHIDTVPGVGTGTYSISGNNINFSLTFTSFDLECSGTIGNNNNMNGDWQILPGGAGTWELTRQ